MNRKLASALPDLAEQVEDEIDRRGFGEPENADDDNRQGATKLLDDRGALARQPAICLCDEGFDAHGACIVAGGRPRPEAVGPSATATAAPNG